MSLRTILMIERKTHIPENPVSKMVFLMWKGAEPRTLHEGTTSFLIDVNGQAIQTTYRSQDLIRYALFDMDFTSWNEALRREIQILDAAMFA